MTHTFTVDEMNALIQEIDNDCERMMKCHEAFHEEFMRGYYVATQVAIAKIAIALNRQLEILND